MWQQCVRLFYEMHIAHTIQSRRPYQPLHDQLSPYQGWIQSCPMHPYEIWRIKMYGQNIKCVDVGCAKVPEMLSAKI